MAILKIFFIVVLMCPFVASASDIDPFSETLQLQLGYFLPQFGSDMRVDNANIGRGTDLNLEDRLALNKESTTLWGNLSWRFADNHRIQLGLFDLNRSGHREIDEEIRIGDKTYPIGASLDTNFKIRVIPISYLYSFMQTSELEISGVFGLQWSEMSLNVAGSVTTNPGEIDRTARASAKAPLPLLGADVRYYITPEFNVGGNLGAFLYKISASNMSYQGYVASATVDTNYWFVSYFGIGAAVNFFYFNVEVADSKWQGKLDYQYWGPQIYLTGRF